MSLLGHKAHKDGVCSGVSALALVHFFRGNLAVYDEYICLTQKVHEQYYQGLVPEVFEQIVNLLGSSTLTNHLDIFLYNISLFQYPEEYVSVLNAELDQSKIDQLINILFPDDFLKNPVSLRKTWRGIYNPSEIFDYYSKVDEIIKKANEDFSLVLECEDHRIIVFFEKASQQWRLVDPNLLLSPLHVQDKLQNFVAYIFKAFSTTNNVAVFSSRVYTPEDKVKKIDEIIASIEAIPEHVLIHRINKHRANLMTSNNVNLLCLAIADEDYKQAAQLLLNDADPNAGKIEGENPIALSLYLPKPKIFKLLLQCGADINEPSNGWSPVAVMVRDGLIEFLEVLLMQKIKLPNTLVDGTNLIDLANSYNQIEVVNFLKDYQSGKLVKCLLLKEKVNHYLIMQMSHLSKDDNKRGLFKDIKRRLRDCYTNESIKKLLIELKSVASIHRETSTLGFFKGNWIRNPSSYNAYEELLKDNRRLLIGFYS